MTSLIANVQRVLRSHVKPSLIHVHEKMDALFDETLLILKHKLCGFKLSKVQFLLCSFLIKMLIPVIFDLILQICKVLRKKKRTCSQRKYQKLYYFFLRL